MAKLNTIDLAKILILLTVNAGDAIASVSQQITEPLNEDDLYTHHSSDRCTWWLEEGNTTLIANEPTNGWGGILTIPNLTDYITNKLPDYIKEVRDWLSITEEDFNKLDLRLSVKETISFVPPWGGDPLPKPIYFISSRSITDFEFEDQRLVFLILLTFMLVVLDDLIATSKEDNFNVANLIKC